jgi:hypothetical protein
VTDRRTAFEAAVREVIADDRLLLAAVRCGLGWQSA